MRDFFYTCLSGLLVLSPLRFLQCFGSGIGRLMWFVLPKRRKMATDAVCEHLGVSREQARRIAYASFLHSGRAFAEILFTHKITPRFLAENVEILHRERAEWIAKQNRPLVFIGAHIGGWEISLGYMASFPYEQPKQVVAHLPHDADLSEVIIRQRSMGGVKLIPHRNASRSITACLRQNGIAGLLVDQNCIQRDAIFLPFLGKIAAVNMGPALLALRGKALMWPLFMLREKNGKFRLYCGEILDTLSLEGSLQERIVKAASWYTKEVEKIVRDYPEQWFWMHNRWKTRPSEEGK